VHASSVTLLPLSVTAEVPELVCDEITQYSLKTIFKVWVKDGSNLIRIPLAIL
jgi:hypothetical protein